MTSRVKVSSRFQIAFPAEARRKLHIRQGDYLLVDVREGSLVIVPEPRDYAQHLRGLHREIWDGLDAQEYVSREREAWQA